MKGYKRRPHFLGAATRFRSYNWINFPACIDCGKQTKPYTSTIALLDRINNSPTTTTVGTTEHYSHWYDNKSCNSRVNSGTKDSLMSNVEVPNLYTTLTPKSFLPPSPLRTKQFVMPLKLQQLEPQKKPTSSDLTVTLVHRKLADPKNVCNRGSGSVKVSKGSTSSSTSSSGSTKQQNGAQQQIPPDSYQYADPLDTAPIAFINRLAEMTQHQSDTIRFERSKKTKTRTKL